MKRLAFSAAALFLVCSALHAAQWGDPIAGAAAPAAAGAAAAAASATATTTSATPLPADRPRLALLRPWLELPEVLAITPPARTPVLSSPLSLPEAARLGLANSPDVQAAQYREQSFAETRNAARGALLPHLELRLAKGRGHLGSTDPELTLDRADTSAVLSQAVYDEPARREWERQGLLADSAGVQRGGVESQTLLDSGLAYLSVLQARIGLALGEDYEKLLDELLRYISERAAAGGASPADRERVKARVANARAGLADSKANLQAALRNLQRLTGSTPMALQVDSAVELLVPPDSDAALELARASNSELQSARLEQQAAESERLGHRGRFLPRVGIEITHARNKNAAGTEAYFRDTKAMAVVTVPLANGGADWAQMRAAEARRGELEARAVGTERRIVQDIEIAYANLRASSERFAAVKDELEGNRKVVDAFRAQLVGANRQLLDVLDAYQRLHQSRLDLVQVLVSTAQNEWRVAHLTGALRVGALGGH